MGKIQTVSTRLTTDERKRLKKAHVHYVEDNQDPISLAEYLRRLIKMACAMELGVVEMRKAEKVSTGIWKMTISESKNDEQS